MTFNEIRDTRVLASECLLFLIVFFYAKEKIYRQRTSEGQNIQPSFRIVCIAALLPRTHVNIRQKYFHTIK